VDNDKAPPATYADFESEQPGGWLRTLVQFFAIPLLIVCVAVGIYVGISLLIGTGPRTASDFVDLLRSDTINRRWQAAYELASRLQDGKVPAEFRDPALVEALCGALRQARAEKEDPPRMAPLILAILGRLKDPASLEAVREATDDEHGWIRSQAIVVLGTLGDDASREKFVRLSGHEDPGTRQASLEALASLDQVEGVAYRLSPRTKEIVLGRLADPEEDVRFTAALILAHARDGSALPTLLKMLDRSYLEQFEFDDRVSGISRYRVHSNVILKAITAVERLESGDDAAVAEALRRLTDTDQEGDHVVRDAARGALARLKGIED